MYGKLLPAPLKRGGHLPEKLYYCIETIYKLLLLRMAKME